MEGGALMKVQSLTSDQIVWPLSANQGPHFLIPCGTYKRQVFVDPFPCYAAPEVLVGELVAECVERFPLRAQAQHLMILDREGVDRFNGVTHEASLYRRDDGEKWEDQIQSPITGKPENHCGQGHSIVIAGKRVPHHPAMLRYLIAHEYGHAAFHEARRALGYREHEEEKLEEEYMRVRGTQLGRPEGYSGGTWHKSPGEIIANDFRVIVARREAEFWPHDVPHPHSRLVELGDWWAAAAAAIARQP